MRLALQAASGRRHPRVPAANERAVLWVVAERPRTDARGRSYYRVVEDIDGTVYWPRPCVVYRETVELMSPATHPVRVLLVADVHTAPGCHLCARGFRTVGSRVQHERVCGVERPSTLHVRQWEAGHARTQSGWEKSASENPSWVGADRGGDPCVHGLAA